MSVDKIILWIMAVGVLLGALDKITGNHFGLGERFDAGFHALGPLALGMVGIVCLAPVIADKLGGIIAPVFRAIGADSAMFGAILANDMGGYSLAMGLADNADMGLFSGAIIASMLGCTLVFSIPVGLSILERKDHEYYSRGLLIGLVTIPIGGIVGGLVAGFDIIMVLMNLIPVAALSILLAVGLLLVPHGMVVGCLIFGRIITIIIYIALAAAAFTHITGVTLIPGMTPIMDALECVSGIGVVLLGTFPVMAIFTRVMTKPLGALGRRTGLDVGSTAGVIISLANAVPTFGMMKDMKKRGIVLNTAWLVPASAALGDHLGFTAGVNSKMIAPMIAAKISAGIIALALAFIFTRDMKAEG